jgi:hypothetical protein
VIATAIEERADVLTPVARHFVEAGYCSLHGLEAQRCLSIHKTISCMARLNSGWPSEAFEDKRDELPGRLSAEHASLDRGDVARFVWSRQSRPGGFCHHPLQNSRIPEFQKPQAQRFNSTEVMAQAGAAPC